FAPVSPRISARAAMPCLNSSGNVASDVSSTPRALRPFQVKATVTQRLSFSTEARTSAADCTVLRISLSHARPPEALRNDRNSYRPVSAGVRVSRMCWISSNSSMWLIDALFWESLHLVEHVREGGLELQCLLDLLGAHIGIFPVFEETRALVLADELDEFLRLGFPIFGEAFEVFEDSINAVAPKRATASSVYL